MELPADEAAGSNDGPRVAGDEIGLGYFVIWMGNRNVFNGIETFLLSLTPRLSPGTVSAYAGHKNPASPPCGYRGPQGLGERAAGALE
jgi:hypothetical protein